MVIWAVVVLVLLVILIMTACLKVASDEDDAMENIMPIETDAPKETVVHYPVPLDQALQDFIVAECIRKGVSPCIVFAQIGVESDYKADAIGDNGNSFGLMQIYKSVHLDRMERLGVTDLLDPYQNVTVGIDIMSELLGWNKGLDYALSFYTGMGGADCAYARLVQERAEQIDEGVKVS